MKKDVKQGRYKVKEINNEEKVQVQLPVKIEIESSSVRQNLEQQQDKLKHCAKLFEEKRSSTSDKRPCLKVCLEYVRGGDILVVKHRDRLAHSTLHLCQIAEELKRKGMDLQLLDQQISSTDATGRLLFNRLGAIVQFETEIRAERQTESLPLSC